MPKHDFPPLLQQLHDQGVVNLDKLEALHDQRILKTDAYNHIRTKGHLTEREFDTVGMDVLQQFVSADALQRLADQGVVSVDGSIREALSGASKNVKASTQRWAVLFGDYFILVGYDIFF